MNDAIEDKLYERSGTKRVSVPHRIQGDAKNTDKLYAEYPAPIECDRRNKGNSGLNRWSCFYVDGDAHIPLLRTDRLKFMQSSHPDEAAHDEGKVDNITNCMHSATDTQIEGVCTSIPKTTEVERLTSFALRKELRASLIQVLQRFCIAFLFSHPIWNTPKHA